MFHTKKAQKSFNLMEKTSFLLIFLSANFLLIYCSDVPKCEKGFKNCCPDYKWNTEIQDCEKCLPGYIGNNCSEKCPPAYYGDGCQKICHCDVNVCNISNGCPAVTTYTRTFVLSKRASVNPLLYEVNKDEQQNFPYPNKGEDFHPPPQLLPPASDTSSSCPVSRNTVKSVLSCPQNEKELKEAELRKNCTAFSTKCQDPEKLVYHCVIGPNHNEVFEVCAYSKIIHWGYCTEYSKTANLIQQSVNTKCLHHKHNPCPMSYNSTEAYKYQSCYELERSSTVSNQLPKGTTTCSSARNKSSKQQSGNNQALAICIVVTTILRMFFL